MDGELRLHLSEEGADAERVTLLTGYLRAELLPLDVVEDVSAVPADEPPPGARVFAVAAVGVLLIALGQLVAVCGRWCLISDRLRPGEGTGWAVRLELGGGALELSQASAAEQERLIELFIRRHATEETGS